MRLGSLLLFVGITILWRNSDIILGALLTRFSTPGLEPPGAATTLQSGYGGDQFPGPLPTAQVHQCFLNWTDAHGTMTTSELGDFLYIDYNSFFSGAATALQSTTSLGAATAIQSGLEHTGAATTSQSGYGCIHLVDLLTCTWITFIGAAATTELTGILHIGLIPPVYFTNFSGAATALQSGYWISFSEHGGLATPFAKAPPFQISFIQHCWLQNWRG